MAIRYGDRSRYFCSASSRAILSAASAETCGLLGSKVAMLLIMASPVWRLCVWTARLILPVIVETTRILRHEETVNSDPNLHSSLFWLLLCWLCYLPVLFQAISERVERERSL